MTTQAKVLAKQALTLTPRERIELAEALLTSVDDCSEAGIEAAWKSEVSRRLDEILMGQAVYVSADDVHRKARAAVREVSLSSRG